MTDHEIPTDFENQQDIAAANKAIRDALADPAYLDRVLRQSGSVLLEKTEKVKE